MHTIDRVYKISTQVFKKNDLGSLENFRSYKSDIFLINCTSVSILLKYLFAFRFHTSSHYFTIFFLFLGMILSFLKAIVILSFILVCM